MKPFKTPPYCPALEMQLNLLALAGEYVPVHPVARALWLHRHECDKIGLPHDSLRLRANELTDGNLQAVEVMYDLLKIERAARILKDTRVIEADHSDPGASLLFLSTYRAHGERHKARAVLEQDEMFIEAEFSKRSDVKSMTVTRRTGRYVESISSARGSILFPEFERLMPNLFADIRRLA